MICTCAECGKVFDVLYPQIWVYKSNGAYYCTYGCIRKMDNRGDEKDLKRKGITLEEKKKAVQICLDGGNPLDYLRTLGSKDPAQTWFGIKKALKETDPDTYAKLPKRLKKNEETPPATAAEAMAGMKAAADEFFGKCEEMGLRLDKEPAETVYTVAPPPEVITNIDTNPLPVCAVRSLVRPDTVYEIANNGEMVFTNECGFYLQFSIDGWKSLSKEILIALEQLEVQK